MANYFDFNHGNKRMQLMRFKTFANTETGKRDLIQWATSMLPKNAIESIQIEDMSEENRKHMDKSLNILFNGGAVAAIAIHESKSPYVKNLHYKNEQGEGWLRLRANTPRSVRHYAK